MGLFCQEKALYLTHHQKDFVRELEHHPVQGQSAGVELGQGARWRRMEKGEKLAKEQHNGLFWCMGELALLIQFYITLTLARFMGAWYPNKSRS